MSCSRRISTVAFTMMTALLAAALSCLLFATEAFAASDYEAAELPDDMTMEAQASNIASGTCGGCTWIIDSNGLLTIKPTNGTSGVLANSKGSDETSWLGFPWNQYAYNWLKSEGGDTSRAVTGIVVASGVKLPEDATYLFYGQRVGKLDLSGFDYSGVKRLDRAFSHTTFSSEVDLMFNLPSATSLDFMFEFSSFAEGDCRLRFNIPNVTTMKGMFWGSGGNGADTLTSLRLSFSNCTATSMNQMFQLQRFNELHLMGLNNSKADCTSMFKSMQRSFVVLEVDSAFLFSKLDTMPSIQAQGSSNTNYWSMKEREWFTPEQVKEQRSGIADTYCATAIANTQSMYRLYNPNSGEHFYTASAKERDGLKKAGWKYEGVGWTAPTSSKTPVYRLYSGTDHHYTTSATERDNLVVAGWKYEGIGWYSDDAKGVPLYRQYNPNVNPKAKRNNSGSHNYTTSKTENDKLVKLGWRAEGIGWYGVK